MKRNKIIGICMIGAFALATVSGCGSQGLGVAQQDESEVKTEELSTTPSETHKSSPIEDDKLAQEDDGETEQPTEEEVFTITKQVYENDHVYIEYPQVENLVNQEITDWYNEQFKNTIKDATQDEGDESASESDTINETFQVTYQSEDMISILIEGSVYVQNTPHPYSYMYGYNINLKTGETMGITDIYTTAEIVEMVDDFLAGENVAIIANMETMEEMDEESFQDAMQEMMEYDRAFLIEGLEGSDFNYYIGEDGKMTEDDELMTGHYSIRLPDGKWAFTVSVSHALGDCRLVRYDK